MAPEPTENDTPTTPAGATATKVKKRRATTSRTKKASETAATAIVVPVAPLAPVAPAVPPAGPMLRVELRGVAGRTIGSDVLSMTEELLGPDEPLSLGEDAREATGLEPARFEAATRYVEATLKGLLPSTPSDGAEGLLAAWTLASYLGAPLARALAEKTLLEGLTRGDGDVSPAAARAAEGLLNDVDAANPVALMCWRALCASPDPADRALLSARGSAWLRVAREAPRIVWPALCEEMRARGRDTAGLDAVVRAVLGTDAEAAMRNAGGRRDLFGDLPTDAAARYLFETPGLACRSENTVVGAMMWHAERNGTEGASSWKPRVDWRDVSEVLRTSMRDVFGEYVHGRPDASVDYSLPVGVRPVRRTYHRTPPVRIREADGWTFFDGAFFRLGPGPNLAVRKPAHERCSARSSTDDHLLVLVGDGVRLWCEKRARPVEVDPTDGSLALLAVC